MTNRTDQSHLDQLPLHWLQQANSDADDLLRSLRTAPGTASHPVVPPTTLHRLAAFDLDLLAAQRLRRWSLQVTDVPKDFRHVQMVIASDYELKFLADALFAAGLKHGLWCDAQAIRLQDLHTASIATQKPPGERSPSHVLLWPDLTPLLSRVQPGRSRDEPINQLVRTMEETGKSLAETQGILPIVVAQGAIQNEFRNSADVSMSWTARRMRGEWNDRLMELATENSWLIWDHCSLTEQYGSERLTDPRQYFWSRTPLSLSAMTVTADSIVRVVGSATGTSRRALVLDLDNTLWGGVIGDDGLDGLTLGQGSVAGEAYLSVQETALQLKTRGVMLAVCSKNDDATARLPFQQHPEMLLKEADIACFTANWDDKPTNLRRIAEALQLAPSSLAFLDDNPMERDCVRRLLPEVAVIETGDDPALFSRRLLDCGYFEQPTLVTEDVARTQTVFPETPPADAHSYAEYLASLEMKLTIRRFDSVGRMRIAQLINKSNQFNLTTRRYNAAQVAQIERDTSKLGLQIRLADRCGDYGIVSVLILDRHDLEHRWHIDTWLMSCRVLQRDVEVAVLSALINLAKQHGVNQLSGEFIPSARNSLVRDHYAKLGFVSAREDQSQDSADCPTSWLLKLSTGNRSGAAPPIAVDCNVLLLASSAV